MSIMDCLQPRTVTVTGARVVRLGINESPHGRHKPTTREQKLHAHREKMRLYRRANKHLPIYVNGVRVTSHTRSLLAKYRAGIPINGNAMKALRDKGLI